MDTVSRHRDRAGRARVPARAAPSTPSSSCSWTRCGSRGTPADHDLPVPRTEVLRDRSDAERRGRLDRLPVRAQAAEQDHRRGWRTRAPRGSRWSDASELLDVVRPGRALGRRSSSPRSGSPATSTSCTPATPYFGAGGRPLVTFVARKVRQWPPDIGTSASGEECRNDEVLDDHDPAVRRPRLPRPGLPGDEARRPHRPALDHRAQRRPPDRPLGDRGGRRGRAGLHRLLRRRRAAAADRDGSSATATPSGWTCAATCRPRWWPADAGPSRCGRGCGRCGARRRTPSGRAATRRPFVVGR